VPSQNAINSKPFLEFAINEGRMALGLFSFSNRPKQKYLKNQQLL